VLRTPEGALSSFLQAEGFPQGDPLASILACLVLHRLLEQLNTRALHRARLRLPAKIPGDDGKGSQAATSSFMDDTFAFLPYEDLALFIQEFKELGPPLGIRLNRSKTKILTTTATQPSRTLLSPLQRHHLHLALADLAGPNQEITQGTRFLGAPQAPPFLSTTSSLTPPPLSSNRLAASSPAYPTNKPLPPFSNSARSPLLPTI
jgi:hypothetical protein